MSTLSWLHVLIMSSSLVTLSIGNRAGKLDDSSCNLELNYKLEAVEDDNFKIIIDSNEEGLKYYFQDKDNKLLNYDFTSSEMTVRKRGKYYCLVMKSKTCHMFLGIDV